MSAIAIDNTMGAALIGCILAAALYGVSTVQTFFYFTHYSRDPWYTQQIVLAVWVFDTLHQALITHTVYHYVISNYFNPTALGNMIWQEYPGMLPVGFSFIDPCIDEFSQLEVLVNGFIGLIVQSYLMHRIWRLSGKKIWPLILIGPFIVGEFMCSLVFTILSLQMTTFAELTSLKGLSMSVNVLAAAGDLLISICLVLMLHKRRTGFKKSNTIISRLIIFTINTGLLTTMCAIASLISILVWDTTLIYVSFFFCIGRFYANTLLATLNARSIIRSVGADSDTNSVPLSGRHASSTLNKVGGPKPTNISIQIDTAHEYMRDDDSTTMKTKLPSAEAM
ncbi:hypothetical protein PC9H_000457 [Pleurotus ostreatus]|uniref:DUF6534 domain-containing protein n=1 Tax=Pleurotus ostreatus TaxID=5322 RepID=A0A8H7A181_PLEOS|nr:uncharacterized protein PC9H_000457 [Pleurotus ostreatus]KAF7440113.1 hypothetical protein PC9H_000457 [Pleurotus ostreatus]